MTRNGTAAGHRQPFRFASDGARRRAPLLVEFTGVTGVGKTSIIREVHAVLERRGFSVQSAEQMVLSALGFDGAPSGKLSSLLISLCTLPAFLRFRRSGQGRDVIRLAFRVLFREAALANWGHLARNLVKRFGVYALVRRGGRLFAGCDFILWDEGTLHSIHNLFVHGGATPDPAEVANYLRVVPKPDAVVWLTAPEKQSVECILQRGHPRVAKGAAAAVAFVATARAVFQAVSDCADLRDRLFTLENAACRPEDRDGFLRERAECVADFLEQHRRTRDRFASSSSPHVPS